MKREVCISVLGIQNIGDEFETVLTETSGTYCLENGFHKIDYFELDENRTTIAYHLVFSVSEMQMSKCGAVAGQFHFIPGAISVADYWAPFGRVVFQVETEFYKLDVKEHCLDAQIKYRLYTDKRLFSENIITIRVCENSEDGFGSIKHGGIINEKNIYF